jgi:hypothetical protein
MFPDEAAFKDVAYMREEETREQYLERVSPPEPEQVEEEPEQ